MRIALNILIGIHSIIHLFGFLKAFGISECNAISQPISKFYGIIWALTSLLFVLTSILIILNSRYWWLCGLLSVIISQILLFNFWSEAKFGSIANLIIFVAIIVGYSAYSFQNKITSERKTILQNSQPVSQNIISKQSISNLPTVVQKWLTISGIIGKKPISSVHVIQEIQLKMNTGQKHWKIGKAEQYFTVKPPAFIWNIDAHINSILNVTGRDKFENGNGEMIIKLLSLISVADIKNSEKVNQASLQRYLAEIVWFPTACLSPQISWEPIDAYSAKATMKVNGTKGSGIFHFDTIGNFQKFTAMRYKDLKDKSPKLWTVTTIRTEERNGIKIPVELKADWDLDNGKWTWLKLKIKEINYNVEKIPTAKNILK
ncbi:DUF6920 family protein [Maribacter sp. CXY002]|uniref:DUF6920 family protein n=1 Tax=Maribacter luteocoastalis TaxID=3407671 RepID=UPI003B67B289